MPQDLEAKEEPYLKFSQVLEIFHLLWAIRKAFFQSMKLLSYVPDMRLCPVSIFKHFQVHGNNLTQDDPFFISLLKNTIKKKGLWVPVSRERKIKHSTQAFSATRNKMIKEMLQLMSQAWLCLWVSSWCSIKLFMGIFVSFPSYQRELFSRSFYRS